MTAPPAAATESPLTLIERTVQLTVRKPPSEPIGTPTDVVDYALALDLHRADREHFVVLHLDARNRVTGHETVSIGSLNASIVHPREVFKATILANAAGVLLVHNHPSGGLEPSAEDLSLTRRLHDAARLLGIDLLDHVLIAPGPDGPTWRSLKELGLL